MPGAPLNTGVIQLWAVTNTPGNEGTLHFDVYYDNTVGNPATPSSQPIINTGSPGRALRVWNTCPNATVVTVVDQTSGQDVTVSVPSGDDVTPVFSRTAAQLAAGGFSTRADVRVAISVR